MRLLLKTRANEEGRLWSQTETLNTELHIKQRAWFFFLFDFDLEF